MAWVTGQSLSYGARMPFHVITSLLRDVLGLGPMSASNDVEDALRRSLARYLPDDEEAFPLAAHLMGLTHGQAVEGVPLPTGDFLADRLAGAVLRLLKGIAAEGPLVVAIEDIHWSDAASVNLIEAMLTLPEEAPVLLACTTRDEPTAPGWEVLTVARQRLGRALTEIHLEPLDRPDSRMLVANLLEIESLPASTRDLILDKADGNPLFVEEVIRMLTEQGAIEARDGRWVGTPDVAGIAIPDTIHGLVLARIDRLPDEARRVLRLASCIDRRFSLSLLEDVARAGGLDVDLGPAMARLEAASLLTLEGADPELEYAFSHALVQDAAYESVLKQERRAWHGLVAEALLERYPERELELADRLARHFDLAGNVDRAIHYLTIAGDRAVARHALVDARALYQSADELLSRTERSGRETDGQRARVTLGLLSSGVESMTGERAMGLLQVGRAAAERAGDLSALSDLLFWEVMLRELGGERPDTSPELRDALDRMARLDNTSGDAVQRSQALARRGLFLWWVGDYRQSIEVLDRAGAMFRERGDLVGAGMAEGYMAIVYAGIGAFDEAVERLARNRELAKDADRLARLDNQLTEAAVAEARGDYRTSIEFATQCLEGAAEIGALGCATVSGIILGTAQLGNGAAADAKVSLERSLEYAAQGYLGPQRTQSHALLAAADGMIGDLDAARSGFGSALQAVAQVGNPFSEAQTRSARGLVMATHPDGDAALALEDLDSAAATFEAMGARPALARTLRARGLALARLGRIEEADRSLTRAATMAGEMDLLDRPWPANVQELEAMRSQASPIQPIV